MNKILNQSQKARLRRLTVARVVANFLDLVGLAGIAFLATAFGSLAGGVNQSTTATIPGLGSFDLNERTAVLLALGVAGLFVAKSGFSIWLNLRTSLVVAQIESQNAKKLARRFFKSGNVDSTAANRLSDLQNRFLYSCTAISDILNARVTLIAEGALILALFSAFLWVNAVATIALFGFLGLVFTVLGRLINHRIDRNSALQLMGFESSLQQTRDLLGVQREVRLAGLLDAKLESLGRVRELGALGYNVNYTLRSTPRFVVETSLILGIFAFLAGVVVLSDLSAQAVTIGVFMTGGLRVIASALPLQAALTQIRDGSVRAQLAFEELLVTKGSEADEENRPKSVNPGDPQVRIDGLTFTFAGQSKPAIEISNLELAAFTKTAFVGKSGAGKSTLFELMSGQFDPSSGSILIGGIDTRDLTDASPGYIALVTQRPHLVTASIAENVSLRPLVDTDLSWVDECIRVSGLESLLEQPEGLLVGINADSSPLSGGEIQRLGLARALYQRPKILLLDEATSALDAETEELVSNALDALRDKMTIVLIAHRLSTVQNADLVVYLDEGRVLAKGSFESVQKQVPDFAKAAQLLDLKRRTSKR